MSGGATAMAAKPAADWDALLRPLLKKTPDFPAKFLAKLQTARLTFGDRVHFVGYQPCPAAFLRAMDVFSLTSRSEGFPVSLLEAWLAGLPVVCPTVGGIPDVVTHATDGLLFRPGDEAALVEGLASVLNDGDLAHRLGQAGRRAVRERYSVEVINALTISALTKSPLN